MLYTAEEERVTHFKKIVFFALILVFLLGFQSLWAGGQKEGVLINGMDADFPPFSYMEEGKPTGFDVEAVEWIAGEMGFKVESQPIAWDGIIEALRSGKIDMIASGMGITEERKELVSFTVPYWQISQAVAVRTDSDLNLASAFDNQHKIGSQRGCTGAMWVEDNLVKKGVIDEDKLVLYEGFSLAVQDLLNGRIDAAITDDVMVEFAIKGKPLKIVGTIATDEIYGYAVRQEDTELLDKLNEGLKRLMASPKWEELKEKYFSE
jgi:polar amino acid transport system substrate-binding protein